MLIIDLTLLQAFTRRTLRQSVDVSIHSPALQDQNLDTHVLTLIGALSIALLIATTLSPRTEESDAFQRMPAELPTCWTYLQQAYQEQGTLPPQVYQ